MPEPGRLNFIRDANGDIVAAESSGEMPADRSAKALQEVATEVAAVRELFSGLLRSLTESLAKAAATPPATAADLEGFRTSIVARFDAAAAPVVAKLEQQEQDRQRREYRATAEQRATAELRKRGAIFGVERVELAWTNDTTMEATCRNALGAIIPLRYMTGPEGKLTL